jgi:protein subunit release factor A
LKKLKQKSLVLDGGSKLSPSELSSVRSYKAVEPLMVRLEEVLQEAADLQQLSEAREEDELRRIAQGDLDALVPDVAAVVAEIANLLVAPTVAAEGDYDLNDASLEVQAGVGGLEAGLFAQEVFEMYLKFAEESGFTTEVTEYCTLNVGQKSKFSSTTGIQKAAAVISGSSVSIAHVLVAQEQPHLRGAGVQGP